MRVFDHLFTTRNNGKKSGRDWFYDGDARRRWQGPKLSPMAIVEFDQTLFRDIRALNRNRTAARVFLRMQRIFCGKTDQLDDSSHGAVAANKTDSADG